ncbi:MAG: 30S ribosomal protein S8 [Nanoarchaeota archaeon]|nr:30S ribosomal protein S8 [Nanoarchaeota archaeon]
MLNDPIAMMMSNILHAEQVGKDSCTVTPASKHLKKILELMNAQGYVGSFEETVDGRGNILRINLLGKVNACGVVKPRFSVKSDGYEKFEKRFLPAANFGFLIVSTSKGFMTHQEAKEKHIGGKLICYVY